MFALDLFEPQELDRLWPNESAFDTWDSCTSWYNFSINFATILGGGGALLGR